MCHSIIQAISCISIAISIALGAFAAHGLQDRLSSYELNLLATGTTYLTSAALGALILSALNVRKPALWLIVGAWIFCGSLLGIVTTGVRAFGAITPIGGTLMIASWLFAARELWKRGPE